ncbi:MAG TPA: hypothetical protein ENI95_00635 [Chloroflexi bacterium]|nr:hypothetical protein [Chloroflexota bacterium]
MNESIREWEDEAPANGLSDLTRNDRFSAVLVILITLTALALGLIVRQQNLNQVWLYTNREAGIEALYPAAWLVDEKGDYVVRIFDPKARPFKTQFMVTIMPASGTTSVRNILDSLTLQRSVDLPAYRVLNVEERNIGGLALTQMDFAFVDADPNPFIQRLPVVVLGTDLVILDGDRAIIVTYMAEEDSYQANFPAFQRFFASLQY